MNKTLLTVGLILISMPKPVESNTSMIPFYIYNAASKFDLDVALLFSVCKIESNCRTKAINHNDGTKADKKAGVVKKSYGLFQIQVPTARALGFVDKELVTTKFLKKGKVITRKKIVYHTDDLLKPEVNAWYAAKLLRHLYDKYDDTLKVLSAYNAGRPTKHNKEYVNKILRQYAKYKIDKKY